MMEQVLAQLAWIAAAAGDEKRAAVLFGVTDPAFYDAFRYGNQLALDEARAYALND